MKAKELLRLYQNGERNFVGANLQGQSFQGQDLSGVDFSKADIRGTNFSDAKLIGVNFCRAEAGLQFRWVVVFQLFIFLLAVFSGFLAIYNEVLVAASIVNIQQPELIPLGWMFVVVEIAFFAFLLHIGISFAITFAIAVPVALALGIFFFGAIFGAIAEVFVISLAVTVVIAGVVVGAGIVAEAVPDVIIFAILGAVAGAITFGGAGTGDLSFAIASILISAYVGWLALKGNAKYSMIKSAAIAFVTCRGTSFRGADLTDVSFNHAQLKSVDLRNATLTRASWLHALNLDCLRPGTSFLGNPQIRTLVETGQGQGIDLTDKNLRGINLTNAQLKNANFKSADLSEATLVEANLTGAKLIQTRLDQTNLTRAILTGGTIEDWGITRNTNLQGVSCKYVYMRQVNTDDPDPNRRRKPDNYEETFADGEFGDFIKPIVDTLDLYHNSNVDSRAMAIAFKQLAENNPDAELEIVAIERRGTDKFLLKARTVRSANHSILSQEYFATYNQIRALAPRDLQLLLDEKDDRIYSLTNTVETLRNRPTFYINGNYIAGDHMTEKRETKIKTRGGNVNVVGGDNSGVINLGDIHNAIQQLPSDPTQPNLKALLHQLQTAIAEESELDDTEKAAALVQVKKLAEAGQAPQDSRMKQLATKATHILKGIAAGLTEGAKLVTAWDKVGTAIMAVFSLH